MQAHANFTYPIPEMDLLNALDDAALEQIIFAEKESDYEVYVDHPSNTVSINPKRCGGGVKMVQNKAWMPSILIKTSHFFWEVEDDRNRP